MASYHVLACRYCWSDASIRCLAIMGIAQGLASNTLEYAWKLHLSQFCPTPQAFTSFLGDVASYTGVVTVLMMLVAPTCFKLLGWRRTARATPNFLLYAGVPFFLMCIAYQVMMRMAKFTPLAQPMLSALAVRCRLSLMMSSAPAPAPECCPSRLVLKSDTPCCRYLEQHCMF